MEIEVSIDKFVIDYKDVPHSAFLRFYMLEVKKYKVKMKIYSGTYCFYTMKDRDHSVAGGFLYVAAIIIKGIYPNKVE